MQKLILFFVLVFSSSAFAEITRSDASISGVFNTKGDTTVTGSNLFTGKAETSGGPEITFATKPFSDLPNVFVAGRLSSEEHKHEAFFTGTSLGRQKCDTSAGAMVGLDLTPDQPIDIRVAVGAKHFLNCSEKYAMGGVPFAQSEMSRNVGTAEVQLSGKLGFISENLSKVSLGAYARYSGEMKSTVTVPGNTILENKTGGAEGGIFLKIPFGGK